MKYQTVYERHLRKAIFYILWCSPYLLLIVENSDILCETVPSFRKYFIFIFLACMLLSWIMIAVVEICSRKMNCFGQLRSKRLLNKYGSVPAEIVDYKRIPHNTSRPGKWMEYVPVVSINGSQMIGYSFVNSSPEIGTKCSVVVYHDKCWVV